MATKTAGPYSIGSKHWPGLAKLIEECGEVAQVVGKIIAANGAAAHWDGSDLTTRLEDEIADTLAALKFAIGANNLDEYRIAERAAAKLKLFRRWHCEHCDGSAQLAGGVNADAI